MTQKNPDLPGQGEKPTERDVSDLIPDDTDEHAPDDWSDVGSNAAAHDEEELPRREQMNVDIAHDVKERFYEHVQSRSGPEGQIRFAVEDLIRLYLQQTDS
jgi:hypothetical protein